MGAFLLTRAFFRSAHLLLLFALRRVRDAGVVHCPGPARGPANEKGRAGPKGLVGAWLA